MTSVYGAQKSVNNFLSDKIRQIIVGEVKRVHILTMQIDLTNEHAVSVAYVNKRIALLLEQYPSVVIVDGYLVLDMDAHLKENLKDIME